MGIYDRDWYKDHAKKRDGSGSPPRTDFPASGRPSLKRVGLEIFGDWHWSLIAVFWVVLALVLALGLKYFR